MLLKRNPSSGVLLRCLASALSGVMLSASFPPLEWAPLAWMALVPVLLVCARSSPRQSFKWGCMFGCVFWFLSISWISYASFIGWILLSLYCALYFAAFCFATSWWIRRLGVSGRAGNPAVLFVIPAVWTGVEFMRSVFISGFPWNQLGVSQFNNLALIQCAEWGGVYLVSYLIALVNTAVALTVVQYLINFGSGRYRAHPELFLSVTVLALCFWHGNGAMRRYRSDSGTIVVAAVQPNIPQTDKWSEEWFEHIYARLRSVTAKAISESQPDLVVWPETAVPDFVLNEGPALDLVNEMLVSRVPLLVGSLDYSITEKGTNYYNSSLLFMPGREKIQSYDKQHLVLFGEYIPFENIIPFARSLTPMETSLAAGTTGTVFKLNDTRFGVLICFEDTIPRIARALVRNGARLLVNQTNDAWFDPSSASRQQMTHCVFRSVENRVSTVRATNTGVTCFIDRNGSVYGLLDVIGPHFREPTFSSRAVFVADDDMPLTFYTKYGDVFAAACLIVSALVLSLALYDTRGSRRGNAGARRTVEE